MQKGSVIFIASITCALTLMGSFSHVGTLLEEKVAHPLAFSWRHSLGKDPVFSDRIKILSYDQKTVRAVGSPEKLKISDWAYLIRGLDESKPSHIFIDKMFSTLDDNESDIAQFNRALKESQSKVVVGAHIPSAPTEGKESLDASLLKTFTGSVPAYALKANERHVEGPDSRIAASFHSIGHLRYAGDGRMKAVFSFSDKRFLPLFGVLAANKIDVDDNKFFVNNATVPLDTNGQIIVNLMPRANYWKHSFSLASALPFIEKRQPIKGIEKGDIVVVLPLMYTGNVDFKESPVGTIEGGFLQVANINSTLTNTWITPWGESVPARVLSTTIASALGGFIAWLLAPLAALVSTIVIFTGAALAALTLFSHMSILVTWLPSAIAFLLTSLFILAERARHLERHAQRVSNALEGLVSPTLLSTLKKEPELLRLEPKEIQASVMFVDIEGFSLRAEIRKPGQVFLELREQLARVSDLVHKHNGIVDKTLGDGLLCFFGYSYDPLATPTNHAADALACAVEIQRECAGIAIQQDDNNIHIPQSKPGPISKEIAMPLRIGINSGPVYLGNLGTGFRVDFTIVGDTVNFAKRLEDACETFRVMISKETRELLRKSEQSDEFIIPEASALHQRMLSIKHHHELMEGWECDPFANEPEMFRKALNGARERITRNAQRWSVPQGATIHITVNRGEVASLLNFSLSGVAISNKQYLARKVQVTIDIDSPDGALRKSLEAQNLLPLVCLVRWGSPQPNGVQHGLQILNLTAEQREALNTQLIEDLKRQKMNLANAKSDFAKEIP